MSRNELCSCGSGKRYKHCHGRLESQPASMPSAQSSMGPPARLRLAVAAPSPLHLQALAAHRSGALRQAEALYRRALELDPADVESLHMLGMVEFERRHYRPALEAVWEAAERTGWSDPVLRQNMGLVLAKLIAPEANMRQEALVAAFRARKRELASTEHVAAHVSVVLTVHNQASSVGRAIASVGAQSHSDIDLVVVDDGSADDSAQACEQALASLNIPTRLLRTAHRGIGHAANHGAGQAQGPYLAFLDAGDAFTPDRIERMVRDIARDVPTWGFSQVEDVEATRREVDVPAPRVSTALQPREFLAHDPVAFTLLERNVIGPWSNLFLHRDVFHRIGGFHEAGEHAGWDFALRAADVVEPIPVARRLYIHTRTHPANVGAASGAAASDRRSVELITQALRSDARVTNAFSPRHPANRVLLLRSELRSGHGDRIPIAMLRSLAAELRAQPDAHIAEAIEHPPVGDRVALVVLGMYRSGTSAFARALNLCGAVLPQRVLAAKLGINPKGFWESEAVTDLDVRLLEHLGGEWNRVDFELPTSGHLVDEFLVNAREILATEYGNAPLVLIKDPRVCVLAPLWHRALQESGYRPAYVVVVRHPLEVAGSIESQGDMPLAAALGLWLTYMQRVERFVERAGVAAVHVRYAELLEDWRGVVRRIARRLEVPLSVERHAEEVDAFLETGMRNHRADDTRMGGSAAPEPVWALYRRMLERCERDL